MKERILKEVIQSALIYTERLTCVQNLESTLIFYESCPNKICHILLSDVLLVQSQDPISCD